MELFKLFGKISIDANEANQAIDETTGKAKNSEKEHNNAFSKIGGAAVAGAKVVAGAGAVMGGAFIAAIEGTREYRTSMGQLETAFDTGGHAAGSAKKTFDDLNAVLGDSGQATEAAQHLAKLTDNEKDLQTWTDICTGVFATFGESIPIETLTESANEVAKSGELTGSLVDALVWAGIGEEEFQEQLDACNTEQERQNLIMDTLNGTYKEASDQYKETNKDVMDANRANEALTGAFAELGRVGEPILNTIKEKVAEFVQAGVPMLESFIEKVKDLKQWITENKDTINTWVGVILGASVAVGAFLLILNWGKIMTAASKAIQAVRTAVLLFNAALIANPIGIIVALIAGLVAAFVYLWNTNEGFRKFWLDMWEKVKSASGTAIKWISGKFDDLKKALTTVKEVFGGIKDTITEKINAARDAVDTAIGKIKGFFPLSIGKIFSNLKIPSISVSGGKAPYGIAGKGSLPSFSVNWNAKGGILTEPTIFGVNPSTGTLLGGGEAGKEAIVPIDTLQAYVDQSVNNRNKDLIESFEMQISRLISFIQAYFPAEYTIMLDTGILAGQLAPEMDSRLAGIYKNNLRGNTR